MAKQIIVNTETKALDVTIEARNNVELVVSRAVSSGVTQINAGQNISVTGISNVTIAVTGTVPTANTVVNPNQPNITSLGTLTGLVSSGTIQANLFIGNVQGNIVGNIVVPGTEGDILFNQGGNAGASSDLNFNDTTNVLTVSGTANVNILNVGEVNSSLIPTSNITLDLGTSTKRWKDLYLSGNTIYLGNNTITSNNGNISFSGSVVVTDVFGNGAGLANLNASNVVGIVSSAEQANIANVANSVAGANVSGQVAYAAVANSVAAANVVGAVANAQHAVVSDSANSVSGANVVGVVANAQHAVLSDSANSVAGANVSGQVANAIVAGTVYTNAQPNITSLGTLTNLSVSGNASVGNLRSDNLQYANGAPYVFTTNAAGQNTQVQFNDGNLFAGSANFTFNKTSNTLTVTNIVGNGIGLTSLNGANVTGQVANATVAGTVYTNAQPNITSLGTLTTLSVSGDATITGNLTVTGNTSYSNVTDLVVSDPIIEMGGGPNNTPLTSNDGKDRGTLLQYYTTQPVSAFMGWDNSGSEFIFGSNVTVTNDVVTVGTYGNLHANVVIANINAANIIGTVASAEQANVANVANSVSGSNVSGPVAVASTAYSVDGANVTGQVAYAAVANSVAGANVSGQVAYAAVANSVAGANVSGAVALATQANTANVANSVAGANVTGQVAYAAVANSVAVANVSGIGNIAVINLDGNVSNVLKGDGTWGVGGGGGGTPGGANTQLQFNNDGVFGGITNVTYDGSNLSLGNIANVKITGGGNYQFIKTDGTGNLAFQPITNTLTVGTRSTAVNIGITNYTMNVESRTGNVTVNVN